MTNQEFSDQLAEIRENLAITRQMLDQGTIQNPVRSYAEDEVIDLVDRPAPARLHVRPLIEGVNYPAAGENWQELNQWRARYGLPTVAR